MRNRLLTGYLLLLAIFWISPAHSDDCLVSTDARSLMSHNSELQSETLVVDEGRYSAVLKNGDLILATFAKCDLGLSVHYFSVVKLDNDPLLKRLKLFLTHSLASDAEVNQVIPQLNGLSSNAFKQAVIFEGLSGDHQVNVKPSSSPVYSTHIQYDWIPPEH